MAVDLNHTIVAARDKRASAAFLADVLGLDAPTTYGPFAVVTLANDVSLDFIDDQEIHQRHYAFLVTEREFDEIFGRIRARGWTAGPIRSTGSPGRSTRTTAAGARTGRTRTVTSWRSSPGRTADERRPACVACRS